MKHEIIGIKVCSDNIINALGMSTYRKLFILCKYPKRTSFNFNELRSGKKLYFRYKYCPVCGRVLNWKEMLKEYEKENKK